MYFFSFQKQTRSLLILLSTLSVVLAVRLQTRTPHFSTADNPTARESDFMTRFLTFSYLPVFNLWLLLFPHTLSFDWGMDAVPRITSLSDSRNLLTCLFYFTLVHVLRHTVSCIRIMRRITKKSFKEMYSKNSCSLCQTNCFDMHSTSCRTNNNNNTTYFQSTSCVCLYLPVRTDKSSPRASGSILFSVALLTLPFLPAANVLYYVGFVVAERVLYMPSAGLCLLLGLGSAALWNAYRKYRSLFLVVFVSVLVAFSVKTMLRNRDWHDEESLYRSALSVNPPKGNVFLYKFKFYLFRDITNSITN